ncbi:MAG: hypothetical protein PWP34_2130 [Desulfuromonadales bacterium]|nr:hypothetical protein [Desulfuromonadales bacterium]
MPLEATMKFEHKEIVNGKTIITTSKRFLFWHIITKYEAQKEFPKGYWEWLRLPNRNLVPDAVSFQLDAWNRM